MSRLPGAPGAGADLGLQGSGAFSVYQLRVKGSLASPKFFGV